MRKIPEKFENPIDNVLIDMCEYVSPSFYKHGFTPNMITTLSNISAIIVILLLLHAKYIWAAIFFILAYFFDCLDGNVARKYNMTTKFGDYYDHVSDITKTILILYTMYYINAEKFFKVIPVIIITAILMLIHFGCQEKYYNGKESDTLDFTKKLCPINLDNKESIENNMKITRYFGSGTYTIVFALAIVYYDY
jgi:hypothetical protein